MAVDVSKIPNNSKFDPVREAILKLQKDVRDGVSGVATVNSSDGNITITNSGNITVGTVGETITIGINDSSYLTEELNDLTAAVTWANVPDANITQSSVTQHQAALSITESQISDLGNYLDLDNTGTQTVAGNIVIEGDLTTSGSITYINSTHLDIGDNIIKLNADITSTTAPTEDAGFYVSRGSSPDVSFLWDEQDDRFSTYASALATASLYIGSNQVINASRQFIGSSTISSTVPYFTFSGDTNTGVGRATNNMVSLIADGTKVLEANNTGVDITGTLDVSGSLTADGIVLTDEIITSADFSATNNRFKLTLTQADTGTIEASFDDVVLSESMAADYIPYVKVGGGDGDTTNAILNDSFLKINGSTLELDWDTGNPLTVAEHDLKMRKDGGGSGTYYQATYAADSVSFLHYASASDIDTAKVGATTTGRVRINDTYNLPAGDGTSGQVLSTNGSGDLSWVAAGGGSADLQDVTDNGATTTRTIQVGGIKTDLIQSASQASESFIDLDDDLWFAGTSTNVLTLSSKSHMVFVNDTNSNGTTENFSFYTQGTTDANATKLFEIQQGGDVIAYGNIIAEDAEVHVGDVSGDNWTRIKHAQADGYGFDWTHNNATVIVNEQGTTNEALVLGDVNTASTDSGLFGISYTTDGGANWTKKLDLRGNGDLYVGSSGTTRVLTTADEGSGNGLDADTVDGLQASQFLRSDADDTVSAGVTYTWNSTDIHGLQFTNASYGTSLYVGGWSTSNSTNISRLRTSSGNFHLDSASNGNIYLNHYSGGIAYIGNGGGYTYMYNSARSPIFYDSNDTNYYVNPASTGDAFYTKGRIRQLNQQNSTWPYLFTTTTASNTNSSGFWVGSNGYPDMRLRRENSTVRALISSWERSYTSFGFTDSTDMRAPIFYDNNNTGYYIHGDGTSRLNLLNVNATGTSVGGIGKVMFPYGAEYSGSGTVTGAFKITLPQSWTNTMMTMKITIFDYSINESFEVHCGGYNYAGGGGYWVNTHAKIIANGESDRNFNVRFGHDGSKCCILIGETSSSWAYPKVVVTEWVGGHSAETFNNWDNEWDISAVTTLPSNIDQTRSNNQIGRYQSIVYDANNTTYYVDPASGNRFQGITEFRTSSGIARGYIQATETNDAHFIIATSGGEDISFRDGGIGGQWNQIIRGDGQVLINSRLDVPVMYDRNNTGYYVNPAATSVLERLYIYEGTNGGGAQIRFSDHASGSYGQYGTLEYVHSDSASYGSGNAFKFYGSESSMSFHVAGKGLFTGDIIAYYSDMRLKTKLGDIEDPIGKIQALNGFYYEPNEVAESYGYEKETRVGLSAQEVEAVLPEIVTDAPIGDGYKTVDYAKLVPVLVEAIKEQQKQIDELKSLINKS